jgi:hypothetical protein
MKEYYFSDKENCEAIEFIYGYPNAVKTPHGYAHLIRALDKQTAYEYLAEYLHVTAETIREKFDIHEYHRIMTYQIDLPSDWE